MSDLKGKDGENRTRVFDTSLYGLSAICFIVFYSCLYPLKTLDFDFRETELHLWRCTPSASPEIPPVLWVCAAFYGVVWREGKMLNPLKFQRNPATAKAPEAAFRGQFLELMGGVEPPTFSLRMRCSAIKLYQHFAHIAFCAHRALL